MSVAGSVPAPRVAAATPPAEAPSALGRFAAEFAASRSAVWGLRLFCGFIVLGLLAPVLAPQDPYDLQQIDILDNLLPPGAAGHDGEVFWLGSDGQGRDMLSAMLYGLRTSLFVALTSMTIALSIGVSAGLLAAYRGGWTDTVIMRAVDLQLSLPTVLVALMLLAVAGSGVEKVILAMVVAQWATFARVVRGQALVEREREYMLAARGLQLGTRSLLFRHLLPNCLPPIVVLAALSVGDAVALEATLSFLGVGMPVTQPSLGMLIANGFQYLISGRYWVSIIPGLLILAVIVSVNMVGDHFRDLLNPRLRR